MLYFGNISELFTGVIGRFQRGQSKKVHDLLLVVEQVGRLLLWIHLVVHLVLVIFNQFLQFVLELTLVVGFSLSLSLRVIRVVPGVEVPEGSLEEYEVLSDQVLLVCLTCLGAEKGPLSLSWSAYLRDYLPLNRLQANLGHSCWTIYLISFVRWQHWS